MRRWITHLVIAGYLGALAMGIGCQALKYNSGAHPFMYFLTWDMFCGWTVFESRYHLIGEGESGTYYWLSPGPWGEFSPYGDLTRNHYDYYGFGLIRMAMNTAKHTDHEPLARILLVEECWPKKYNLPDHLWEMRCAEPKDPMSYFWLRDVYSPEGEPIETRVDFLKQLFANTITKNPRLQADYARGRPVFMVNPDEQRMTPQRDAWSNSALLPLESPPNAN